MTIDSSEKLRAKLERRREKSATTGLQRIPFMLDTDLADRVEQLAQAHNRLQAHIEQLEERRDFDEPEDGGDVRASGDDLTEIAVALDTSRTELARMKEALEVAVAEAKADQVTLVFRRAGSSEYEELLAKAGGSLVDSDETLEHATRFQSMLVERCFLRVEAEGEDAGYTWPQFVEETALTFGEVDPIRALVYANNRRGGNSVPF